MATTLIALIRGINVGPSKRVAMADLRDLLAGLGYTDVRTHLQSGNAVFSTGSRAVTVAADIEEALAEKVGVRASVVVRTGRQLTAAMAADPLSDIADNGSRHFLGFLSGKPDPARWRPAGTGRRRRHRPGRGAPGRRPPVPLVPQRHPQGDVQQDRLGPQARRRGDHAQLEHRHQAR